MVKIAFSGAACTGKTTLIKAMNPNYKYFVNVVRDLMARGIRINEKGTVETQDAVMEQHLINLESTETPVQVYDRCLLDWFVFTQDLHNRGSISDKDFKRYEDVFVNNIGRYDIICYIDPEFKLKEDGVRNINPEYYNNIIEIFHRTIYNYSVPVEQITGTVAERLERVKCLLRSHMNPR